MYLRSFIASRKKRSRVPNFSPTLPLFGIEFALTGLKAEVEEGTRGSRRRSAVSVEEGQPSRRRSAVRTPVETTVERSVAVAHVVRVARALVTQWCRIAVHFTVAAAHSAVSWAETGAGGA